MTKAAMIENEKLKNVVNRLKRQKEQLTAQKNLAERINEVLFDLLNMDDDEQTRLRIMVTNELSE